MLAALAGCENGRLTFHRRAHCETICHRDRVSAHRLSLGRQTTKIFADRVKDGRSPGPLVLIRPTRWKRLRFERLRPCTPFCRGRFPADPSLAADAFLSGLRLEANSRRAGSQ